MCIRDRDNPCDAIRKLPEKHKEMSYYTPEQFKEFESYFEESEYPFKLLYRVLMFTGIRMGEALALTWRDVFLDEGYIKIRKSAYYRNGKTHIGSVKTTQSNLSLIHILSDFNCHKLYLGTSLFRWNHSRT